jgi:hypothetical protein
MSIVSESEHEEGKVRWALSLDVTIEGIQLPFRLRITTDDLDLVHDSLSDFQAMIVGKINDQFNLEE